MRHPLVTLIGCILVAHCQSAEQYEGTICTYADLNFDTFTDILAINRSEAELSVWLASANTLKNDDTFKKADKMTITPKDGNKIMACAVGDFNGDSFVDVLLTYKTDGAKSPSSAQIWYGGKSSAFTPGPIYDSLTGFPSIMDKNVDGLADLVLIKANSASLFCALGSPDSEEKMKEVFECFPSPDNQYVVSTDFTPTYADMVPIDATETADLLPELVVGYERVADGNTTKVMLLWQMNKAGEWVVQRTIQWPFNPNDNTQSTGLASAVVSLFSSSPLVSGQLTTGDFNADGLSDLILPRANNKELQLYIWHCHTKPTGVVCDWVASPLSVSLVGPDGLATWDVVTYEEDYQPTFDLRVGDPNSDGYPDLIVTLKNHGSPDTRRAFVLDNRLAGDCDEDGTKCADWRRVFDINWNALAKLEPPGDAVLTTTSFFDLYEDGILDYVYQYKQGGKAFFSPRMQTDQRDATFLKVEVYTPSCDGTCHDGLEGSVISYAGATIRYTLETENGRISGLHTQFSQTGYRALQLPFALFGLGRNPNFVELLEVGRPSSPASPIHHSWPQIVPNSRMYIVPPKTSNDGWVGRLYVTPSRLVLLSFATLCGLCGIVLLVITFFWWRERREDIRERELDSHRFNFAM